MTTATLQGATVPVSYTHLIIHEGMKVLPLCREHHTEAHQIGQLTFNDKYHISGGIILDRKMCKLYGVKAKEEDNAQ